ncbi:hypothetical protein KZ813_00180 [Sphingomonas sp. RHCKR7]|uniref:hypothetical protein n=1 Tax=Sphingomonas folli TaxID=2862497 RepID=UPI001CA4EF92|nr:hypothetical protein [Sphingomonas folli]MBW6525252.1 hypothetical protein [Sphingomonas folli]
MLHDDVMRIDRMTRRLSSAHRSTRFGLDCRSALGEASPGASIAYRRCTAEKGAWALIGDPDWTDRMDKRGLDPLGMQNAGVALYQSLLPGISNVTLRMRYYGYYCWVSDAYARSGASDEFAAWRSWVRRAEAIYALVSSSATGQVGVGGVEWADRRLALKEDVIDFAEAASNEAGVVRYLRQSLGVFGGAYYSQMVDMGLFRRGEHGIQRATNGVGLETASAFRTSIGPAVEALLLTSISSARVARADLSRLAAIVPSAIPDVQYERSCYERLLFVPAETNDRDASRAASLRLILITAQALGCRPNGDMVRWHLFAAAPLAAADLERQRIRWEAYQCQDLMQIAAASLLDWSTELMGEFDSGRTPAEIGAEVQARLLVSAAEAGCKADVSWASLRADLDPDEFDYRGAAARLISRRGTAEGKAWDAIRLMAALDGRVASRPELSQVATREFKPQGPARSVTTELAWLGQHADRSIHEVIASFVVERVVRRHSWVAMQKLRRQRDYTFLFDSRDGRLVRRSGYPPVPTNPRLGPAIQFLEDIGLIGRAGVTERALSLIGATK